MTTVADKENNPNKGQSEGTDSHLIGPRQEYRRTGKAPDDSDAMVHTNKGEGKPTTPYRY
jgi:hypothetical protein